MKLFFRLFFRLIHAIVGPILLLWNSLTPPTGIHRPQDEQQRIDGETRDMVLYQFRSCPFCIKTRRAVKRMSLNIETRDALRDQMSREELLQGGGKIKVPCLKVSEHNDTTWMYESNDIISYLKERFA